MKRALSSENPSLKSVLSELGNEDLFPDNSGELLKRYVTEREDMLQLEAPQIFPELEQANFRNALTHLCGLYIDSAQNQFRENELLYPTEDQDKQYAMALKEIGRIKGQLTSTHNHLQQIYTFAQNHAVPTASECELKDDFIKYPKRAFTKVDVDHASRTFETAIEWLMYHTQMNVLGGPIALNKRGPHGVLLDGWVPRWEKEFCTLLSTAGLNKNKVAHYTALFLAACTHNEKCRSGKKCDHRKTPSKQSIYQRLLKSAA